MTFAPHNEKHAIVEAVFGVTFAQQMGPKEFNALDSGQDQFRNRLPGKSRPQGVQIVIGPTPQLNSPQAIPVSGIMFDEYGRDGKLMWRLRAEENGLFINCLDYTNWAEVWPKVFTLFQQATEVAEFGDVPIQGVVLQYVNIFHWRGENNDYDLEQLLTRDSKFVTDAIFGKGPLWHLHQGWFRQYSEPYGQVLERLHLDGTFDAAASLPTVRIDSYASLSELEFKALSEVVGGSINSTNHPFDGLHLNIKEVLMGVLHANMSKRIGLDA